MVGALTNRLSEEERCALLELEAIREEEKVRRKERGIDFFVPNRPQHKALKSKARIVLFCGGNRSGKSSLGAYILACHITKKYPDYFPIDKRINHPVKVRVATTEYALMDTIIEPKIKMYLPKEYIVKIRRSPQGYINRMVCRDGSTLEFLTMEQDTMAFEGQDIDVFWGDEPIDKRKWIATQRGLIDRGGQSIITFTPIIEPWMKEELVDKADGINIDVIKADIRENRFDIKGNPILEEDKIKFFENMLDDDMKQTRLHGEFFHMRGMVYPDFCNTHIRVFNYTYPDPVYCVLDPHDRLPHHIIWGFVNRTGDIYVYYEKVFSATIKELAVTIMAIERNFGFNMKKRLIDPNFGRKPLLSSKLSVIQELASFGVRFTEANDDKEAGRMRVKEYLRFDRNKPIDINNVPKLFFHSQLCPLTINSIRHHQYDDWVGKKDKDPKEDVKPKDEHGADCVRYLVLDRPTFRSLKSYEPEFATTIY